ncbi:MAG: Xaa-Pro dipeptidase [Chitinophagaceae bacterium]|nr:Xaa-Pro dipeptidase [Oligoflexus sp.]
MSLKSLFAEHVRTLQGLTETILAELKLDALVIDAGESPLYFEDDQDVPYRCNHHFRHWCPLEGPQHLIKIVAGHKPLLRVYKPADFWYEVKPLGNEFWMDGFQIEICDKAEDLWKTIAGGGGGRVAYHGPNKAKAKEHGLLVDVEGLLPRLNWNRVSKTPYEQQCLVDATRVAAKGHIAAERSFRQGGSELDIHFAYLQATRSREIDLPYENIIALNEKGAYLHYAEKRDDVHNGLVLLIDAGANAHGYASDITRTYATEDAPEEFRDLLTDMTTMQKDLCASIRLHMRMNDLHYNTHERIAQILLDHKILLGCDSSQVMEFGLTQPFFPHGLGHMLGVFVHDVAGRQTTREGTIGEPDPRFPKLRSLRPLEAGTTVTIEPGLYFIKLLLEPFRSAPHNKLFNWTLIDRLVPCGGIRIEDNIIMGADGQIRNVTREFLP